MSHPKIISVSRRTDIPAFYIEWFLNGIKRGYVDSINPFNRKYVSRISLIPEDVLCFVFWTKNPKPFLKYLAKLDNMGYQYYFQFTLNPYSHDIEQMVPSKNDHVVNTFIDLSKKIGKDKVIWRYDPILLTHKYTKDYHYAYFEKLVRYLSPYTNRVVISFIDLYKKTERNTKDLMIEACNEGTMNEMAEVLAKIALNHELEISTCSEKIDLSQYGIKHSKCIDDDLIHKILGTKLNLLKDKGQRKECGCVESIDIGANNTCKHFCLYCYANSSRNSVERNHLQHDPHSSLLCGTLKGDETIYYRNGDKAIGLKEEIKHTLYKQQSFNL